MDAVQEKKARAGESATRNLDRGPEMYLHTHESASEGRIESAEPQTTEVLIPLPQIISMKTAIAESTKSASQSAAHHEQERVALKLRPEEHDAKMAELLSILHGRGVAKAIAAAEATSDPHLMDDFHRVLVEYLHEGLPATHPPAKNSELARALGLSLLEITLPRQGEKTEPGRDPVKTVRDFIALMESFYRGTVPVGADNYFSFEIANPVGATLTSLYLAVPTARRDLFEKQLLGLYPTARVAERPDDYNIFVPGGFNAGSFAHLKERPIFALRTFENLTSDTLDVVLTAFSKLDAMEEGAALQFVITPNDRGLGLRYRKALEDIRKGKSIRRATDVRHGFSRFVHEIYTTFAGDEEVPSDKRPLPDDPVIKSIERKIGSPLTFTCVRILASAKTRERAERLIADIAAPFATLGDTAAGTQIGFTPVRKRKLKDFTRSFSYRYFDKSSAVVLSTAELATVAHLPRPEAAASAPDVHQEHASVAPAPARLPREGTLLGTNDFRGTRTPVYLAPADRLRHLYAVGQTGTGKSTFLKNLILQDIKAGDGVCFIDPHGSDIFDILGAIPKERIDDVIYFDPGNMARPLGLNMLEYDAAHPEQKTLVVDELLGIFNKLFDMKVAGGPAFEQYFRNAALLVMESPENGNTLLDIARVFSDDAYRAQKLAACRNPIVLKFWEDIAERASGEQGLQNYAPYITNKFDVFTTNEIMRPIIAQQKSSMNFRDIMDNKKILLVNLAKGRIGDINGNLLGLIIVGKFLLAALSRADSPGKDLPPFYLHIDEFQNFSTPSIGTILSEARKYKLSLTVAHQFIAQLSEDIRDAVFGNVGNIVAFRVGASDAEFLEKQFAPAFAAADLLHIDNYNALARILAGGEPQPPFNIAIDRFEEGSRENALRLAQISALLYGRPRKEIEEEIAKRYAL